MSVRRVTADGRPLRVGACLSLTGRYSRFGLQAAMGLRAWRSLDGAAELVIEDDESSPRQLEQVLPSVARRCDILLGPYSTQLMRPAGRIAADSGWLLWNHGGSGDDVQAAYAGHVVSVLTPASRYPEPFLTRVVGGHPDARLWITHGKGSFGRQVAVGAEVAARRSGIETERAGPGDLPPHGFRLARWSLLCAGTFEEDTETVRRAQALDLAPEAICAVAAGVREFATVVPETDGVFGMGQWFPGTGGNVDIGPAESAFLAACAALSATVPDYPAVQAAAGAAIAAHCARCAGGTSRDLLWEAAAGLDARTLFGEFKIGADGAQAGHEVILIRWTAAGPVPA